PLHDALPILAECSTSSRRSSGLWPEATSSTASTPRRRRHQLAMPLSATRAGRVNHMNTRIGMANRIADRSGWEIAEDLGAISPMTRWKKVTITKATTKETVEETASGSRPSNKGSMRWCTAGVATAPQARYERGMYY